MKDLLTFAVVFLIVIGIAVLITMESKRVRLLKGSPSPKGFRGWLLVLAIHESIQFINPARGIAADWRFLPSPAAWFELALLIPYLLIILFTIVTMYRRRRYFRFAYLAQACFTLVISGLSALGTSWQSADAARLAYTHGQILGSALAAIVWTIYVFRSERVRNTFVRPEPVTANLAEVF